MISKLEHTNTPDKYSLRFVFMEIRKVSGSIYQVFGNAILNKAIPFYSVTI